MKKTLEQLRERAIQSKRDKYKVVTIKVDDIELNLKKIDKMRFFEKNENIAEIQNDDKKGVKEIILAQCELIALHCEEFKDSELQKSLGVQTPGEAVFEIFGRDELFYINDKINSLYGAGEIRDEIKN